MKVFILRLSSVMVTWECLGAVLTGLILCVIIVVTVFGNTLVVCAIATNRTLQTTTNYFILNLAVADLLLGLTVLPFSTSLEVTGSWMFGRILCDMWVTLDVLCCTASIFSLCVISLDRFIGVTRPLERAHILTKRRALRICIALWILSGLISVVPLIGWRETQKSEAGTCAVTNNVGYVIFSNLLSFYLPLLFILVFYFRVYRAATAQVRFLELGSRKTSDVTLRVHFGGTLSSPHRPLNARSNDVTSSNGCSSHANITNSGDAQQRRQAATIRKNRSDVMFRREAKAAKTLGIVVGVFVVSWFPFFFVLPLGELQKRKALVTSRK